MENLITTAGQYGALGLSLLASFWYINKKDTEYREERNNRDQIMQEVHENTLDVVKANTSALSELTTIIKNK